MGTIIGMLACSCAPVLAAQEYALTGQFNGATAPGGKLSEPTAMAVDESTGDIYVVERGSHIVAKLDAEGNYISELTGTPTGPGGAVKPFTEPSLITVENFPGSTRGDVYVLDEGPLREGTNGGRLPPVVDQFSSTGSYLSQITGVGKPEATGNSIPFGAIAGMAAGPGGALWLAERAEYYSVPSRGEPAILEFEEAGSSTEPWKLALKFPDGGSVGQGGLEPYGIALDSSNHVYLDHEGPFERWKVSSSGGVPTLTKDVGLGLLTVLSSEARNPLFVVDPITSDVFVDDNEGNSFRDHIVKFGQLGEAEEEQFGWGESIQYSLGVAVNGSKHVLYASSSKKDDVAVFTELSPAPPAVTTGGAQGVTETTATLTGEVNPQALHTSYWFEYGTSTAYGQSTLPTAAGEEAERVPVPTELKSLTPGTTYHYRLVAENVDGTVYGQDETFTATVYPPPTVTTGPSEDITQTSATITATVDPHGLVAGYDFEVGGTTSYGARIPGIVTGEPETVRLILTNLVPGTTYHYRLVAESEGGTGTGEDQTFTTGAPLFTPAVASIALVAPPAKKTTTTSPKALTKAQKLAKALKACKREKTKSKRAACERTAKARFSPKPKKKR
jgi:hypothetical protein